MPPRSGKSRTARTSAAALALLLVLGLRSLHAQATKNTVVFPFTATAISSANFSVEAQLFFIDDSVDPVKLQPIPGKTLEFVFNGSVKTDTTNSGGLASVEFLANLLPGTTDYSAKFAGDAQYKPNSSTNTVTIRQRPVDVTALAVSNVSPSQVFIASATLFDQTTAAAISSETLSFVFGGSTVTGTTNDVGLATASFTAPTSTGTLDFYVTFSSTTLYGADRDTGTVEVVKIVTLLTADDVTIPAQSLFTASATLIEFGTGDPIEGRTVTFTFQGDARTGVTDALGLATTTFFAPTTVQNYSINANFAGDGAYLDDSDNALVTAIRRTAVIAAATVTVRANAVLTASATLVDAFNGNPIDGETVEFIFNGTTQTSTTADGVPSGLATSTFSAPSSSGSLTYTVEFLGSALYDGDFDTGTLYVELPPTELAVDSVTVLTFGLFTATATLTGVDSGAPLGGKTVLLVFENSTKTVTSDGSGVSTDTFTAPTASGTYVLRAQWGGETDVYAATVATVAVTVLERGTSLAVSSDTVSTLELFTASATLTDSGGPLLGATVYFLLNGSTQTGVTNSLGRATTGFAAPVSSGTFELQATFTSSGTYAASVASAALTVTPQAPDLAVDAAAVFAKDIFTATATFTSGGSPVAGQTVRFILNGASQTAVTDALGEATTDYVAPSSSGTYMLEAYFDATPTYEFAAGTQAVTVSPRTTTLTADDGSVIINEIFTATATLTDAAGGVAGQTIRFVFNGSSQTAVTDALGVAATDYATPASTGSYLLETYFDATPTHTFDDDTVAIAVLQRPTDLALDPVTVRINKVFYATATLTDIPDDGAALAGKTIHFLFGGTPKSAVTNSLGVASVTYTAQASSGPFTLTAAYDEEMLYASSSSAIAVQVLGTSTTLTGPDASREINKIFTASVTLTSFGTPLNGETVRFVFNGATHTATTDATGLGTTDYFMPASSGTYTIEFYYDGTPILDVAFASAAATALPVLTTLAGESASTGTLVNFVATATLNSSLGLVSGETVRFVVDGTTQYAVTNGIGVASTTFAAPGSSGTHAIEFYYDGSGIYAVTDTTETLTLSPQVTTLDIVADTTTISSLIFATATLTHSTGTLAGTPVNFVFQSVTHTVFTDALGEATTGFTAPAASGTYVVDANFEANPAYIGSSSWTYVGLIQRESALAVAPATSFVSAVFTASATLTDFAGGVGGKTIRFVLNGASQTAVTDDLGLATTDYIAPISSGPYRIEAYFDEDAGHIFAAASETLTALPAPPTLSGPEITILINQVFTATVTVTSSTGALDNQPVRFIFEGQTRNETSDPQGEATTTYTAPASSGTYQVDFEFDETPFFGASASTATVIVLANPTELTAPATGVFTLENFTASATLTSFSAPVAGVTIRFALEGTDLTDSAVTDGNGTASVEMTAPASSGTYRLLVDYDGSGIYEVASATAAIEISTRPTLIVTSSVTVLALDLFTATATLTDIGGAVEGLTIRFVLDGVTQTDVTDALGVATTGFYAPASSGTYELAVYLDANATYDVAYGSEAVTVEPRATVLAPGDNPAVVDEIFTASATLTDPGGAVAGETVSFWFLGSTQTGVTSELGVATTDFVSPASSGPYVMNISLSTSPTYVGVSSTVVVPVAPRPTLLATEEVEVVIGELYTATATLTEAGNPMVGRVVRFVVDGTSKTAETNDIGVATITYQAPSQVLAPTLPLEAYFDETPVYAFAWSTAVIRLKGQPAFVVGPNAAVEVGQVFTASGTVTSSTGPLKDHTIRFVLDGTTQYAVTNVQGKATTDFASPPSSGTYNLEIHFDSTTYHAASSHTAILAVTPIPTGLTFAVPVSSALALFKASATLTDRGGTVEGETVRFVVDGNTQYAVTNDVGLASTTFAAPAASGTHAVRAYFDGTERFGISSAAATLTVLQRETFLAGQPIASITKAVFTASATLTDLDGPVIGETVYFYFEDSTDTAVTDANGVAGGTFTASATSGTYRIDFELPENATYLTSTASDTLTLTVRPTSLFVAASTTPALDIFIAVATFTDVDGGIAGETIAFVFEGVAQTGVTDGLGVATTGFYAPASSGTYQVDVSFQENATYAVASGSAAIRVVQRAVNLTGADFVVDESAPFIVVADISDLATSEALEGKDIRFVFESSTQTVPTNAAGRATAAYTAPATGGPYVYSYTFDGDVTYASATAISDVFVGQASILVAQNVDAIVNSTVAVIATLRNNFAQPVPNETISFYFQGATATATTDADGVAQATFTAPSFGGNFPYTADYAGNGTLAPATDDAVVSVSLSISLISAFDVEVVQNQVFQAKARLIDVSNGDPIPGKTVNFVFNGSSPQPGVTDATGLAAAAFSAPLTTGTYDVTATFAGDSEYQTSNSTGTVTVRAAGGNVGLEPTRVVTVKTMASVNAEFTAQATLYASNTNLTLAGQNILFLYGSSNTLVATDANGVARATFTAPSSSGAYVYAAQYAGDPEYATSQSSNTISVDLHVPNDPARVTLTPLSATQMELTWDAVTKAENGEDITALIAGYAVEMASTLGSTWTQTAFISTAAARSHTVAIETYPTYYRIRTRTSYNELSNGKTGGEVSAAPQNLYMANSQDAWVQIPAGAITEAAGGAADFGISVATSAENGYLRSYTFDVMKNGVKLVESPLKLGRSAAMITFSYADLVGGAQTAGAGAANQQMAVFYFNGVEWIKLGGNVSVAQSRVSVRSGSLGKFALQYATLASEFSFTKVAPRIFTPEETSTVANRAVFYFENPADNDISISIWDVTGAIVRRNLTRDGSNMIFWDGKDSGGVIVKGGLYIYQIEGDDKVLTGTVVVAK